MKARTEFKITNWTTYFLQLLFAFSAVYSWIEFKENYDFLRLFLAIFFLVVSFVFYNLGVMYRRGFGHRISKAFDKSLHKKLNRRGRRRLKRLNKK